MKVGCLTYEYPPIGGGGSTTIHAINLELSKIGYDINVVTTGFRDIPENEKIENIYVRRLNCHRKERFITSLYSMGSYALQSTYYSLRNCNEDIIHSYFVVPSGIPGYFLKKIKKKPFVVTIFGGDIYDPTRTEVQQKIVNVAAKRILECADVVTTISHDLMNRINEICEVDVELIHCGVNTNIFCPNDSKKTKMALGLDEGKIYLLSVGRLIKRKGYEYLIQAMNNLLKEYMDVELIIIGEGSEKEKLEDLANKLGIREKISFLGFVKLEELIKYYQACDIFAISSLYEGQCCTILEAMSCGKPVVATNVGGISDSVVDNFNGILAPVNNSEELKEALLRLIKDKQLRLTMGMNSRDRALKAFDWKIIAAQISKIYSGLI